MTTKVVYKEYKHYLYHMIKDFTTYQQALKLKALGFDEPCFGRWWFNTGIHKLNEEELEIIKSYYFGLPEYYILAPTFSQAFRFFREKYSAVCEIIRKEDGNHSKFIGWVYIDDKKIDVVSYWYSKTYEETELACLEKLIEIVEGTESQK